MKGCAPKIAGIGCVFVLLFSAILLFAMLFSDDTEESKEPVARISAPSLYHRPWKRPSGRKEAPCRPS